MRLNNPIIKAIFIFLLAFLVAGLVLPSGKTTAEPESEKVEVIDSGVAVSHAKNPKYSFLVKDSRGRAARWNPCKSIKWKYNPTRQKKGGLADAKAAVAQVSKATGIKFVYGGTTKVTPGSKSTASPKYKNNTSIVIAWASPKHTKLYGLGAKVPKGHTVEGLGVAWTKTGRLSSGKVLAPEYVQGAVIINSNTKAGRNARRLTLIHEVTHVAGLGHVNHKSEVMYPVIQPKRKLAFGAGDKAGLKKVGKSRGCIANPLR